MFALSRLTRDSPSFKDELDIMKFICKDFWTKVFRRQVDNLRTNHQVSMWNINMFRHNMWAVDKNTSLPFKKKLVWIGWLYTWISSLPQGTYVLQDNKFSLLTQLSSGKQYLDQAPKVIVHSNTHNGNTFPHQMVQEVLKSEPNSMMED